MPSKRDFIKYSVKKWDLIIRFAAAYKESLMTHFKFSCENSWAQREARLLTSFCKMRFCNADGKNAVLSLPLWQIFSDIWISRVVTCREKFSPRT